MLYTLQMYITQKGAANLSRELKVSESAVSFWFHMQNAPRPETAALMIEQTNGVLTWEGIYRPYVEHVRQKQIEMDLKEKKSSK